MGLGRVKTIMTKYKKGDTVESSLLQEYIVLDVFYDEYLEEKVIAGKQIDGVAVGKINIFPAKRAKKIEEEK